MTALIPLGSRLWNSRLVCLMLIAIACAEKSTVAESSPVGTFELQQLNGRSLPTPLDTSYYWNGQSLQIDCISVGLRGTVTISASSRFMATGVVREDCQGSSNQRNGSIEGTWAEQNGTIDFFLDDGNGAFSGTLSGGNLVISGEVRGRSATAILVRR